MFAVPRCCLRPDELTPDLAMSRHTARCTWCFTHPRLCLRMPSCTTAQANALEAEVRLTEESAAAARAEYERLAGRNEEELARLRARLQVGMLCSGLAWCRCSRVVGNKWS